MNILFILADQHRYDALSGAGCPWTQTPNLDRLASDGVCFTHCHSPAPLCGPARAALLSGRYPHETGVYGNRDSLDDDRFPSFGHLMGEQGIAVHAIGRTHMMVHGCTNNQVLPGLSWPDPYGGAYGGRTLGKSLVELDDYWDVRIARAGIRRLREAKESGTPSCVWVNLQMPHPPFVLPEFYYRRAESLWPDLAPPRPSEDCFAGLPSSHRRLWEEQFAHLPDEHLQRMKAYYYVSCEITDYATGMLLDALDDLGLAEDTLVVYSSDHGDLAGDHGLFGKGSTFHEGEVRVPLICRWPGRVPAGRACDNLVSLLDLGPSMLEAFGVEDFRPGPARSLWPALRGEAEPRDQVFSVSGSPGGSHFGYMVRDPRWKYTRYAEGAGELYNLRDDPEETTNLWNNPSAKETQTRMRDLLLDELLQTAPPPYCLEGAARAEQHRRLNAGAQTLESEGHEQTRPLDQCDPSLIWRV